MIEKTISSEYFLMECLFLIGIAIFTFTNFKIHINFGLYTLSVLPILYSIFLFKTKRGDKR